MESILSLYYYPLHMEKNNFCEEDVWTGYPERMYGEEQLLWRGCMDKISCL